MVCSSPFTQHLSSDPPLVTFNLSQLILASQPDARDALSAVLGGCCTSTAFCNNLFVDHCIETHCETNEVQRGAVLHHLLNGICVSQPNVPACRSLSHCLASMMHLSFDICTLLLSANKHKQLTPSAFRLYCVSLGLKISGSDRNLCQKLQQQLTRWAPLCDCKTALSMIPHIESFGSGSLLELAALHGIHLDTAVSSKDGLCDIIIRHLVFGECQTSDAALCTSICSALLPPTEPKVPTDMRPLVLAAVINLSTKKTL